MFDKEFIKKLQDEMRSSPHDIKAEVQVLLALEKELWPENFLANCTSRFRREYSHDVVGTDIKEDANKQPYLEIGLSRAGIFDQLPEGLFFRSSGKRKASVSELASDYKTNKKKEADIRKFFQPFDHDFFLQRLGMEREENLLLGGLQSGILNEYFIHFWSLPPSIPRSLLSPLILLLPYSNKIAGDLDLTARSLQQILTEKVSVTRSNKYVHEADRAAPPTLGEGTLGLDMVAGTNFAEESPVFEIQIGPLRNSQITDYLEGGIRHKLLETFNRFFIPVGVEMEVDVLVTPEKRNMVIRKGAEPVLGYSSYL